MWIEEPSYGSVFVGLYDSNGKKLCAVSMDASKPGAVSGECEQTANLNAGDFFLAWGSDSQSVRVRGIGVGGCDMVNASGGAVVTGTARCDGRTLPDNLGPISLASFCLPMTYFKA